MVFARILCGEITMRGKGEDDLWLYGDWRERALRNMAGVGVGLSVSRFRQDRSAAKAAVRRLREAGS